MAQASDPASYIYEGVWTNWSYSNVRGLTLTLSPEHTPILTTLLALLVTMCSSQVWTMLRFMLHQIYDSSPSRNSPSLTHNQQQVILRNTASATQTVRSILGLKWANREDTVVPGSSIITLVALVNTLIFMTAATFSDKLVAVDSTVLSRSPYCGVWNQTYLDIATNGNNPANANTLSMSTEFIDKTLSDIQLSETYAEQCYMNDSNSDTSTCNSQRDFYIPRLYWQSEESARCPFQQNVCHERAKTIQVCIPSSKLSASPRDRGVIQHVPRIWFRG